MPPFKQKGNNMFKLILIWVTGAFIVLQAIQIDTITPTSIDPKKEIVAPDEIMTILKTSCYDCHSYETTIPWYGHIAPISFEVKGHIKGGRAWLNFQEWNNYDEEKKQKIFKGIKKSINLRMPIPMYLKMHEEATLTQEQKETLKLWVDKETKEEE